ncbi:hypothetical protein SPHINGO8AM_80084 [Sphingomonas sp. 8AM]|nr:hypothetical protein SPHINGO8AM_80084 [Sphingomonas sp. 8AM]
MQGSQRGKGSGHCLPGLLRAQAGPYVLARAGAADRARALLDGMFEPRRGEPGTLSHDLWQHRTRPGRFGRERVGRSGLFRPVGGANGSTVLTAVRRQTTGHRHQSC